MEGKLNAKIFRSTVSGAVDLVVLRQKPIGMHLTLGKNAVSKLKSISFESFLNLLGVPTLVFWIARLREEKIGRLNCFTSFYENPEVNGFG